MNRSSAAIVVHQKKILLLLRDNIPTILEPNTWSLPGGCVEDGETYRQALERELDEEICVVPKKISPIGMWSDNTEGEHALYFAELDDDEVGQVRLGNEGQALKFFDVAALDQLELRKHIASWCKLNKAALEKILNEGFTVTPESIGFKRNSSL